MFLVLDKYKKQLCLWEIKTDVKTEAKCWKQKSLYVYCMLTFHLQHICIMH